MSDKPQGVQWVVENWQQVFYHPVVASVAGALAAAFHAFPGASRGAKTINGILSFFIGIYAGPAIVEWREIESTKIAAAIIVACALGGLITANAALEYMRTTKIAQWPFFRTLLAPPAEGGNPT